MLASKTKTSPAPVAEQKHVIYLLLENTGGDGFWGVNGSHGTKEMKFVSSIQLSHPGWEHEALEDVGSGNNTLNRVVAELHWTNGRPPSSVERLLQLRKALSSVGLLPTATAKGSGVDAMARPISGRGPPYRLFSRMNDHDRFGQAFALPLPESGSGLHPCPPIPPFIDDRRHYWLDLASGSVLATEYEDAEVEAE
ncbi:hypothetical protein CK203_006833 [Vitis vinifera]|uniref:Uncharacterized protein n=1 Tax=Vitis vinifera TaxID=29760 RepID=A0A438KBU4_VITVI|nr:hypothetical protein CK203_006833 [Vitis vinifera]